MSSQTKTGSKVLWKETHIFSLFDGHYIPIKIWSFPWNPKTTTILAARLIFTLEHDWSAHFVFSLNDISLIDKVFTADAPPLYTEIVDVFDYINNGSNTFAANINHFPPLGVTTKWKIEFQWEYIGEDPPPPEETWWGLTLTQWLLIGGLGVATVIGGVILYTRRRRSRGEVVYVERERERDRLPERRALPYYER